MSAASWLAECIRDAAELVPVLDIIPFERGAECGSRSLSGMAIAEDSIFVEPGDWDAEALPVSARVRVQGHVVVARLERYQNGVAEYALELEV